LRTALRNLLATRFRRVPKLVQARIDGADVTQLNVWIAGVREARTLKALFGD
jgi:hypothetical protein